MSETDSPASGGSRIGTFLRILNVRLRFIFLMVVVGLVAANWETLANYYDRWRRPPAAAEAGGARQSEYYCPMHPSVVRGEPGSCPICGMPLSQRAKGKQESLPADVLARVQLAPFKLRMGGIGTSPVEYRLMGREIRTVGTIEYDETRVLRASARIRGRIEKLWVNFVGRQVAKGDPLFSIYSPQLLIAQKEVLSARQALDAARARGAVSEADQALYDSARRKLTLWGIDDAQIDAMIRRGTAENTMTYYSPIAGVVTEKRVLEGQYVSEGDDLYTVADLGSVWLQARIFEDQFAGVKVGTAVEVTCTAYPSEIFAGRIAFTAFTVDPATRTIAARVEVANPDDKLRPGMYAMASIRLAVGAVTPLGGSTQPAPNAPASLSTPAETESVDGVLVTAYLALAADLARDKGDAASAFVAVVQRQAAEGRAPAKALARDAERLRDKDVTAQREVFKSISTRMIALLRAGPPRDRTLFVAHCPMVKADWVQDRKEISNPYDHEMPRCGSITATLRAGGVTQNERSAAGYFCPIYPDRLFDQPAECPVDKFPMKYVRIEKVLAVPESAVIDSGTRQVVYRESAPGDFDMIAVTLGPRAGEFYPVLGGLSDGDRVATAGAFLVDAENRLNPAASVQYFGASK